MALFKTNTTYTLELNNDEMVTLLNCLYYIFNRKDTVEASNEMNSIDVNIVENLMNMIQDNNER